MRILFLGNNWVGWQALEWLRQQGEEIAAVVLHPTQRRRHGDEILRSAGVAASRVFDGSRLHEPATLDAIKACRPEIGVSAFFGYLLRREALELMPKGCVNIHPALLPYNRGAYPNVWSIIDGTPAGVTLHYLDEEVDHGAVIAQRPVPVESVDTGQTLYRKLEEASVRLFQDAWPLVRAGRASRVPQGEQAGSRHRVRDVEPVDAIALDRSYTARELINILRARTFPPYRGAYFVDKGRKVYLRLNLQYEEEFQAEDGDGGGAVSHD